MEPLTRDAAELKQLLKDANVEVLEERSDLISGAVEEAFEDSRLLRAMEEARSEGLADKNVVGRLLGIEL